MAEDESRALEDLVTAFEGGALEPDAFPHRAHVQVAWGLARRYDADTALRRLVDGIRAIAARAGRPGAYHVTITRAWFELVRQSKDLADNPELFDKHLLDRYYSPERLGAGRTEWQDPDLHPLVLPPPPAATLMPLVDILRRVPTSVGVLSLRSGATVHATTVSSFTSVSRQPPLVGVCLANSSRTLQLLDDGAPFAVSLLARGQGELATRFSDRSRPTGTSQFDDLPHHLSAYGPILATAAAWVGCRVHALHPCGDHHIVLGEVVEAGASEQHPLVRHDGSYH